MYSSGRAFLAIPGPVEVHPLVYEAMNRRTYGHRTSHFREIYADCVEKFQQTIKTTRIPQFHSGSGSLGLHAAITNLTKPGDIVLNLVNGKFGERVENITSKFVGDSPSVKVPYGQAITPEMVRAKLDTFPDTSLVTITHNETSTGVLNPLHEISKVVHNHGALLMADCITSAGGDIVEMDKWNIDFFVSGSQKCYGLPPGLSFMVFSDQAEEVMRNNGSRSEFYADVLQFNDTKLGVTPFTPAVNMIYGLQAALNLIMEEGLDKRISRHRLMGKLYRDAMTSLGLELFAQEQYRSNTVTATNVPKNVDVDVLRSNSLALGVIIAGGQSTMKGNIFRVGHMNLVGPREMLMIVSVLELAMKRAGADIELGRGTRSIQEGLAH